MKNDEVIRKVEAALSDDELPMRDRALTRLGNVTFIDLQRRCELLGKYVVDL